MSNPQSQIDRAKTINALIKFSKSHGFPSIVMLLKFLWLVDERHFRQTGTTMTGYEYNTFEQGPVPKDIYYELKDIKNWNEDLNKSFKVIKKIYNSGKNTTSLYKAKINEDEKIFTKRQKKIIDEIIEILKSVTPSQISKATHAFDEAWYNANKRYGKQDNKNIIDLLQDIKFDKDDIDLDYLKNIIKEREHFKKLIS